MRPRNPDREDFIVRHGVKVAFSVYENKAPTILLMPTWSIIHSRHWKAQVPFLARHFRVVTFDGRGNGDSDRPTDPSAYGEQEFVADALGVLDATDTSKAVLAGVSVGAHWALLLAGHSPSRAAAVICIGPTTALAALPHPNRTGFPFEEELDTTDGWAKYNSHFWRRHYPDFAEFFFSQVFSEPHSTKQREDAVRWALETDPDTLIAIERAEIFDDHFASTAQRGIRCPVLVIHGTADQITPYQAGVKLANDLAGTLVTIEGGGHLPQARDPVRVNLAMRDFINRLAA